MSTHKYFNRIVCVVMTVVLLITVVMMNGEALGMTGKARTLEYESKLFDTSKVHTVDIIIDDWDGFIDTCESEEYSICDVTVDGERFSGVGIRAKGNTSLSSVSSMNSERYSFKIEFDQYDAGGNYYGLDKLCLNNIIQDNTYMKDYLAYQMMGAFDVAAPLCSYAQVSVNGEVFGLYLAVEAVEDSFLQRNYGNDYGDLYKPDSMDMGGGRGNGMDFDFSEWESSQNEKSEQSSSQDRGNMQGFDPLQFGGGNMPNMQGFDPSQFGGGNMPNMEGFDPSQFGGIGGNDVSLIYSDDDPSSYSNIFDSAKTNVTAADEKRLINSLKDLNQQQNLSEAVDIEQVIRYFVVHNFTVNFDSYTGTMIHNYYLYEEDGALSMIPWDYNLAFGSFMSSTDATGLVNYPIDTPVSGGSVESRPMIAWIFSNEEYTAQYHELFAQFLEQVDVLGIIEQARALIAPYVESDPSAFCSYEEFLTGADTLYTFCDLRVQSIKGQLSGEIGSTSLAQSDDTLIDAGDLDVSAMGSMGGMRGGDMPNRSNDRSEEKSNNSASEETAVVMTVGAQMQRPNRQNSDRGQTMPDGFDMSRMPNEFDRGENSTPSGDTEVRGQDFSGTIKAVLLMILSVVLLIGGVIFAKFYPERG